MTSSDSSWFSLKQFAIALGTVAFGTAAGTTFIPFFGIGSYLGTLAGGFAAGLAFEDRPLLESGVAGVLAGLGALLVSRLIGMGLIKFIIGLIMGNIEFPVSSEILLLTAVLSFGLAALGAHFGSDFRDGMTRPVED